MTGSQLAYYRRQLGLTQAELATALNISRRTIARYEHAPSVPQGIAWALLELKHREKEK